MKQGIPIILNNDNTLFRLENLDDISRQDYLLKRKSILNSSNQGNDIALMAPIEAFGNSQLYTLMKLGELTYLYNGINRKIEEVKSTGVNYGLYLHEKDKDSPLELNINYKVSYDYTLDRIGNNIFNFIAFDKIIKGINILYEKNELNDEVSFGIFNENFNTEIDNTEIDITDFFSIKGSTIEFKKNVKNFIMVYEDDSWFASNGISLSKEVKGIFIYLPTLDLWQYLSKKKVIRFLSIDNVEFNYAVYDSTYSHVPVYTISEFEAFGLINIIEYSIMIMIKLYYTEMLFNVDNQKNSKLFNESNYKGLMINISTDNGSTEIFFSYKDIFGNSNNFNILKENYDTGINIINIINDLVKLQPRMNRMSSNY